MEVIVFYRNIEAFKDKFYSDNYSVSSDTDCFQRDKGISSGFTNEKRDHFTFNKVLGFNKYFGK